jgi:hypothetical protein
MGANGKKRRRGQTLLEWALILPLALLLIMGLVVLGQILSAWLTLHHATREAARAGVVGAPNAEVEAILRDRLYTLDRSQLSCSVDPDQENERRVGDPFQVTARYGVRLWIPIYSMVLPNPYPLLSVTTMRLEGLPGIRETPGEGDGGISPGDFRTQTPGGWGTEPQGDNPGALLEANFGTVFPTGLRIGSGYQVLLTRPEAVRNLLPTGGTPGMLTQNATDPTSTSAGVFMGQVTALTINAAFSAAGVMPQKDSRPVGDLIVAQGPFAGESVADLLRLAHRVIGGDPSGLRPFGASLSDLNDALASINENFVDGEVNRGYLRRP